MIGDFFLVLGIMQFTPAVSYTAFNVASIAYASFTKKHEMLPVLFVNTLALNAAFYTTSFWIEPTFIRRLSVAYKVPTGLIVFGDVCVHLLPSAIALTSLFTHNETWLYLADMKPELIAFAPLYSVMLNIFWALVSGGEHFGLSRMYAPLNTKQWMLSWYSCIAYHFVFGFALIARYLFRTKL